MQRHNNLRTKALFSFNGLLPLYNVSPSDKEKGCWLHAVWQAENSSARQALNQTISLCDSSLSVMLTFQILTFPITTLILFLIPCLSSFTSLPFFPFASQFMSAGCKPIPHHYHPTHPSTRKPTSDPFPCADFSSVKCLPGPTTSDPPTPSSKLAEWMQH